MLRWSCITGTMQLQMSIGESLQRARRARALTQAELGEQAGLSRMTIQRLESDQVDAKLSTVVDVARCVGLEMMLVPASLRAEIEDFIRAGGKFFGREPGIDAPKTAVQDLRAKVLERLGATGGLTREDLESVASKPISFKVNREVLDRIQRGQKADADEPENPPATPTKKGRGA